MRRILISEAGGALSNGTIESLRRAPEPFYLVGVSSDKYGLQLANTDERYLVPGADNPNFVRILNEIIQETHCELVISQHDFVIYFLSKYRDQLLAPVFLPSHDVIERCQDKFRSYEAWSAAGLKVPKTILLNTPADLKRSFKELGEVVWIRELRGGAGRGSLPTDSFEFAKAWIDYHKGWGRFTAAEKLNADSTTWTSIWHNGELVVAQGRKRLYWKFANRSISGVTGVTGTGVTVTDSDLDDLAIRAIRAIDPKPNGIYSVDLTYDCSGCLNPTEINIGRFFTTHLFFTAAGLNLPYIIVKLALGELLPTIARKINPLTPGLAWVREMDTEPALVPLERIEHFEEKLLKRIGSLP